MDDRQLTSLANELHVFQIRSPAKPSKNHPPPLAEHQNLSTPAKRLSSLNVSLDPQFSSKIPTRSPSIKSLKLVDLPHANNSKLPISKRYYSDSKHIQRNPSVKQPTGLPTSKSMYNISLNDSQVPSYLKPTLSSRNRSKNEKENVPLQRRQSLKMSEKRGMVTSSSVMDLRLSKVSENKPSMPPPPSLQRKVAVSMRRPRESKLSSEKELYMLLQSNEKTALQVQQYLYSAAQRPLPRSAVSPHDLAISRPEMYEQLTVYERGEILRKKEIYYTGVRKVKAKVDSQNYGFNFGFDDKNKNYICSVGDHINYRYQILAKLGRGSFGSVICAKDHKTQGLVAIKLVKNEMDWSVQAMSEVKCLKELSIDPTNVIEYLEHFNFRSHICIVTELLLINLYELTELTQFKGLGLGLLKKFGKNILQGLAFVHQQSLIHCDMKPENLMLAYTREHGFHVKIIDFGSSCRQGHLSFSYLQSRFYRAPEVCLGARYDEKIDIWSFGAIMAELFTGMPIFQAKDEYELVNCFISFFGAPSRNYIVQLRNQLLTEGPIVNPKRPSTNTIDFRTLLWTAFYDDGSLNVLYLQSKKHGCKFKPSRNLRQHLARHCHEHGPEFESFVDMLAGCLVWRNSRRMDCHQLLSMHFYQ
ncbi:hypothetical protein KL906_001370 [Ogataea polymorpha]|nr:hypothetical protein KL906_001370 [Ogataea polymorpha]